MLASWREIAVQVDGAAFDCGHFLPEEAAEAVGRELKRFFSATTDQRAHSTDAGRPPLP
jgi:haloacetate dehalogenase